MTVLENLNDLVRLSSCSVNVELFTMSRLGIKLPGQRLILPKLSIDVFKKSVPTELFTF